VLPVRIELTTSALPRMRSTTELRQLGTSVRARAAGAGRAAYEEGRGRGQPLPTKRAEVKGRMAKEDPARAERLAAALRENLRRRKAQARDEAAPPADPLSPPAAPSRP
jgi:hypothetical protein